MKWLDVCPMRSERAEFYACSVGHNIFVFGGKNSSGIISECEKYCPQTNSWSAIASLPVPLHNSAGLVCQTSGSIYLSGGFSKVRNNSKFNHFFCYKIAEDVMVSLPPMIRDRGGHLMVQDHRGEIAVIGGQDHPLSGRPVWTIENFDFKRREWVLSDQMKPKGPLAREFRLNYQQNGTKIFIWAIDFINSGKEILEYCFETKKWRSSLFADLPKVEVFNVSNRDIPKRC